MSKKNNIKEKKNPLGKSVRMFATKWKNNRGFRILTEIIIVLIISIILGLILGIFQSPQGDEEPNESVYENKTVGEAITLFTKKEVTDVVMMRNANLRITLKDGSTYDVEFNDESESTYFCGKYITQQVEDGIIQSFTLEKLRMTKSTLSILISVATTAIMVIMMVVLIFTTTHVGSKSDAGKASGSMTFDDVAGMAEEKEALAEIVDFLKNPKKYQAMGAKIPHGVMLEGDPGTGKTLLAKAVAGEADVPFFSANGSDFVEIFSGVGPKRIRKLFKQAKSQSPSVIFIDEIDGIGGSREKLGGGSSSEESRTLNQLLIEMDGFDSNTGIVVIGATNRVCDIDPALLRSGRFDRKIKVTLPSTDERKAIIELHAKGKKFASDVDIDALVRETSGMSGADIANILNEATIAAVRHDESEVNNARIEEAVLRQCAGIEKKTRRISEADKKRTAYHEAGHAVIGYRLKKDNVLKREVNRISIIPRGVSGGFTSYSNDEDSMYYSQEELDAEITVLMAGRASEDICLGSISTGASNDLQRATTMAFNAAGKCGMNNEYGLLSFERIDTGAQSNEKLRACVENYLNTVYSAARILVRKEQDNIAAVAEYLIQHETMTGEQLREMLDGKEV